MLKVLFILLLSSCATTNHHRKITTECKLDSDKNVDETWEACVRSWQQ